MQGGWAVDNGHGGSVVSSEQLWPAIMLVGGGHLSLLLMVMVVVVVVSGHAVVLTNCCCCCCHAVVYCKFVIEKNSNKAEK